MSLLSTVNEVCASVGVHTQPSVFTNIAANRTMLEMLETANEAAAQIAADTRDWTLLRKSALFTGDGHHDASNIWVGTDAFDLPPDYRRMLKSSEVWISTNTLTPARFIPDTDEWIQRRAANYTEAFSEWTIYGGKIHIWPIMAGPVFNGPTLVTPAVTARFTYLDRNHIQTRDPANNPAFLSERFTSDLDNFRLDERLLKLGMIWLWKKSKGSPYAEDVSTFSTAMSMAMGSDSPAPILVGRVPISANARIAYPWQVPT